VVAGLEAGPSPVAEPNPNRDVTANSNASLFQGSAPAQNRTFPSGFPCDWGTPSMLLAESWFCSSFFLLLAYNFHQKLFSLPFLRFSRMPHPPFFLVGSWVPSWGEELSVR
jgi:hypothetical protein